MGRTAGATTAGYEVVVPGSFGPVHRAALAATAPFDAEVTTTFLLCPRDDTDVRGVVEALEARGLVILDIRRLH